MSNHAVVSQRFHGIGQGIFYSGQISTTSSEYNFVYDCGSLSLKYYLDEAIDSFRIHVEVIDLLIISHFDEDHVNGIYDLVKYKKVRRLILPYVEWFERLALIVASKSTDPAYLSLLLNPIGFFSGDQFDIDTIIIVGGPNDKDNNFDNIPSPFAPIDKVNRTNDYPLFEELHGDVRALSSLESDRLFFTTFDIKSRSFLISATPFKITVGGAWEFEFYNQQSSDKVKLLAFEDSLSKYILKNKLRREDLFHKDHRESIRVLYRKHYTNLNQTSLIVYHGAIKGKTVLHQSSLYTNDLGPYQWIESNEKTGTLLTGDINLKSKRSLKAITHYFLNFLENVSIFSLPHHGARANWNFDHPNALEYFELYISSTGHGRRHHPSTLVIADVDANCFGDHINITEGPPAVYNTRIIL